MGRMRIAIATALALMAVVIAISGYLFLELQQANASLADTNLRLEENEMAVFNIQDSLVQSNLDLRASVELTNALQQEMATVQFSLDSAEAKNRTLSHDLAAAVVAQDGLRSELNGANAKLDDLSERHLVLQSNHSALNEQYDLLRLEVGDIEELESRADALRTEIARLEARHRPLILTSLSQVDSGFACTGSMNPKVTCLDTATWQIDFDPADIVVGAIISFKSQACWSDKRSTAYTAHRVKDIRVTNGVYYFWPKGDASDSPDGCWVPHMAVDSYMVAIHKNTRPENATLRNNVMAARVAFESARNALPSAENAVLVAQNTAKAAENDYYIARDEYNALLQASLSICLNVSLCSNFLRRVNQARELRDRAWNDWEQALDRYRRAFAHYERVFARYEQASVYYDCWYQNALDSEYPGHIPRRC